MDNVSTVIAIYRAVCKQTPLITRVVTLTGEAFNTPINVDVRIGAVMQNWWKKEMDLRKSLRRSFPVVQ